MENKVFSNLSFLSDEEIGLMSSNLSERIDDHLGQIVEERASLQGRCEKHNVELGKIFSLKINLCFLYCIYLLIN